jgi:hypothetical protein
MVKFHKKTDAVWINAAGDPVPFKYVPEVDKKKETLAEKIHKQAIQIEQQLLAFHKVMHDATNEVAAKVKEEFELRTKKAKKQTASITWYNFDKSLKIEADVNDICKWDDAMMTEAHTLLNGYINASIGDSNELIKGLVNEAFSSSKGTIDSRKVFQILKYEEKIRNAKFQKACALIKQAQGIDKTKLYMRVWAKEESGEYRNINLNFSSI